MRWYVFLIAGLLCGLAGCGWNDKAEWHISGSEFGWQTISLLLVALFTPFQAVLKPILNLLQPIVVILQKIGILKPPVNPDDTPEELTIAELIAILTDLLAKTTDPAVKAQLLGLISTAASVDVAMIPASAAKVATDATTT